MSEGKSAPPAGGKQTLVEEGTEFKGTLVSDCPIMIKGKVEGELVGPSLHVSSSGAVSGSITVGEIDSEGELAGQCEAEVVRLSGRVKDRTVIRAKSLEIKLAPKQGRMEVMFGECELQVGDEPIRQEAHDDAWAAAAAAPAGPEADDEAVKGGDGRQERSGTDARFGRGAHAAD